MMCCRPYSISAITGRWPSARSPSAIRASSSDASFEGMLRQALRELAK